MGRRGVTGSDERGVVQALLAVARERRRLAPPPAGAPHFGLDVPPGAEAVLEAFLSHGIFRKYERVLLFGDPLGGAARWASMRFGCAVIGVAARSRAARAAVQLGRAAPGSWRCGWICGGAAALPVGSGSCTHVWALDAGALEPFAGGLAEVRRVLRFGGSFGAGVPQGEGAARELARGAAQAGFAEVSVRPVQVPPAEPWALRVRHGLGSSAGSADGELFPPPFPPVTFVVHARAAR